MSRNDLDDFNSEVAKPKKKSINVQKFFQQFNTLDSSNYGGWPTSVKITCWIFLCVVIGVIGYFLVLKPKIEEINFAHEKEKSLLVEFKEKFSKLRNLQQYQTQLQQMEMTFNQQLELLPKETEIPSLVEDINLTGVKSGLKFKNIRLEPEVAQEFFIEQPISIETRGDYHSFGQFVSGIAGLSRILTLHDFVITATPSQDKKTDIPTVDYSIKAKTYRYVASTDVAPNAGVVSAQPAGGQ